MNCPCGSGRRDDTCCAPIIEGRAAATTAETLMRSRYTAFATGAIDYLLQSHDPETRFSVDRESIARWSRQSTWLSLEILATERGGESDQDGVVEFRARYLEGEEPRVHSERSTFRRVDGHWTYVNGEAIPDAPVARTAKVGRNEPCPCGSGRKFKKCHG